MLGRLTVFLENAPAEVFFIAPGERPVIGRGADADLRVDDRRLSRHHARFFVDGDTFGIEDLGSKNGTFVGGDRIDKRALGRQAWLELGELMARFEVVDDAVRQRIEAAARERRERSAALLDALSAQHQYAALVRRTLDAVLEIAEAERGFVMLPVGDDLHVLAARGLDADAFADADFAGSVGAIRLVLERGDAVITCDAAGVTALAARASIERGGIRALVVLPLALGDDATGVLYADSRRVGKTFERIDVDILTELAEQAAVTLGAARVKQELAAVLAEVDDATLRASRTLSRLLTLEARAS